ncbi:MAG: potassium transporter TrkG [Ilumatobacteraceae bacterium]
MSSFSLFGELVLLGLIQLGGFGIMTIGSVFALVASRRIGLRQRMLAQAEIGAVDIGELRALIGAIAKITIGVELSIAAILFVHLAFEDDTSIGRAAYSGLFHGVSAFNNAGISLYSDSLTQFASDPFVVFPITAAFIIGGFGFPVLVEFGRRVKPRRWSLHTRITVAATAVLLFAGPFLVLVLEWTNEGTLGPMSVWDKLQAAWFQGVTPRTAGFNTIDIGAMHDETLNIMTGLMFIGAGPASTSGGIKVTTFAVIGYAMWSEVRGDSDITVFRRRLPVGISRQSDDHCAAVAHDHCSAAVISTPSRRSHSPDVVRAASAFHTVGLSASILSLPVFGQVLLVIVMLAGRRTDTFVMALALRNRQRAYRYPEERPIIG